jgi:hypothetical protein
MNIVIEVPVDVAASFILHVMVAGLIIFGAGLVLAAILWWALDEDDKQRENEAKAEKSGLGAI